jgi:hypothetical protein
MILPALTCFPLGARGGKAKAAPVHGMMDHERLPVLAGITTAPRFVLPAPGRARGGNGPCRS